MALGSHLERSCRDVASVLEDCVTALLDYGIDEEVVIMQVELHKLMIKNTINHYKVLTTSMCLSATVFTLDEPIVVK